MSPILSVFKTTSRALLVAAVLGAGGLAAAPALAQDPSMSFNIGPQGGGNPSDFAPNSGNSPKDMAPRFNGGNGGGFQFACLSDRQVIRGLRNYGFSRVEIVDSSRRRAEAIARKGNWNYVLRVDKCDGEVRVVDRFRGRNRPGFGLQFSFGN